MSKTSQRQIGLALGELRRAAGFVQTDFLALDFAGVTRHETGFAQRGFKRFIVFDERTSETEADCTGLTGDTAAFDGDEHVELVVELGQFERLAHDHARGFATKKGIERLAVHLNAAFAGAQEHTRSGGFAAAGTVLLLRCHGRSLIAYSTMSSACGCWAE